MTGPEPLEVRCFSGAAVQPYMQALATLRSAVFREWPYLYQGDPEYEAQYLASYARSPRSLFVLALAGDEVVGAATGIPLEDEPAALREPLRGHGFDPSAVFYFGESVLLPAYRGRGIGHRFFDERERFAQALGFRITAFCAVLRDLGDPRWPQEQRSLEPFWRARGYAPVPGAIAQLEWKETWHDRPTMHDLQFWVRESRQASPRQRHL